MANLTATTPVAAPRVTPAPGRRRDRLGVGFWCGVAWLALVLLVAVLAPLLPLQDPLKLDLAHISSPPTARHWLGSDALGRDTLSRVVHGAQVTLVVGLASVAVGLGIGLALGLVAGYYRRLVDPVISWLVNVLLAFPPLVLALVLAAFLGASTRNVIIAIGVIAIPSFARLTRASTIQVAEREYVLTARSLGAKSRRIILAEILPNVVQPVLTLAITVVGFAIVVEGALSFLGLGVPLPKPTWGGIINEGKDQLVTNPSLVLAPALALLLTILALNVVAERLARRHGLAGVRV